MIGRTYMGRYEAKRLLGEGGMGRVYLAWEFAVQRYVVVKVMHEHLASDPRFQERFQRETQSMARLQHPHAVKLYDASLDDPAGPCIVMEYIPGVGLDTLLKENKRLSAARVGRLIIQLCEVLQAAHEQGIVHRDLKPSNLMVVQPDTPFEQIKVMDFGLAKIADTNPGPGQSLKASMEFALGTPSYISPEQVRGEGTDARSDLYSVGVIAYELLSGRLPFQAASHMDMLLSHAMAVPPTFSRLGLGSWVPRAVEELVRACLEKDRRDRPQSAAELADRFEEALAAPNLKPRSGERLPRAPEVNDPDAQIYHLDAWLPQDVALVKIRGLIHDLHGEVITAEPGLIRFRAGARSNSGRYSTASVLSKGANAAPIDIELRLKHSDPENENRVFVTVVFPPADRAKTNDPIWRERCDSTFCDVRAHLAGQSDRR